MLIYYVIYSIFYLMFRDIKSSFVFIGATWREQCLIKIRCYKLAHLYNEVLSRYLLLS